MNLRLDPTRLHAWLLTAALLLAQGLGLAHSVAHAPGVQAGWSQDHEAGGNECRLVDQLAHADVLCGGITILSPVLPAVQKVPAPWRSASAWATPAAYLARAPPRA
ncbi:MAG TPA: hypothetical protein VEZ89_05710 [Rubrivivax sp.]|nr:hypothetical protein [Rubrivivax sp.]